MRGNSSLAHCAVRCEGLAVLVRFLKENPDDLSTYPVWINAKLVEMVWEEDLKTNSCITLRSGERITVCEPTSIVVKKLAEARSRAST